MNRMKLATLKLTLCSAFVILLARSIAACGDDSAPSSMAVHHADAAYGTSPDAGVSTAIDSGIAVTAADASATGTEAGAIAADAAGSMGSGGDAGRPLYTLTSYVFNDTSSSAYLTTLDAIQERADVELAQAREFPGWASPGAFGGNFFMASGEAPTLTRFSVNDLGALEGGETLSFANYTSGVVAFHFNYFINDTTALMTLEHTTRVLWSPSELALRGEAAKAPVEQQRQGLAVAAYANPDALRPDGLFQPYHWHDDDWYAFHPTSQVVVYGVPDASVKTVIDVPCPALYRVTADEDRNLYMSPLGDLIAYQLMDQNAPKSCVARINAGESAIAPGWPRDFSELTEGRRYGEFRYLKDGRGILSVYHHERATVTSATEPSDLIVATNWRLWLVDLQAWSARPIESLDWLAGGTHLDTVDGRVFLFTSRSDFSSTTVYEIFSDGRAARLFATPGYAEKFVRVR